MSDMAVSKISIYLPKEGLQGEEVPSHILWDESLIVKSIKILYNMPLSLKSVFNAKTWEKNDNLLVIEDVEVPRYVGLLFETCKISETNVVTSVEYIINTHTGKKINIKKEIKLFRPQLQIKNLPKEIMIDPKTGFVKGKIRARNIGRGILFIQVVAAEGSPIKVETPPRYREFAERFITDLSDEFSKIVNDFPQYQSLINEMLEWDKKYPLEFTQAEKNKFKEFAIRLANTLAKDLTFLERFLGAYAKALARNTELIEAVRRVVTLYESIVSNDIIVANPLDEVILKEKTGKIVLKITHTDSVFNEYDDIILPAIELKSSEATSFPVYKLFEWG
jgi:hypothetical protein